MSEETECPVCGCVNCNQLWHDYYQDTKHADFEEGEEEIYKAGYEMGYNRLAQIQSKLDCAVKALEGFRDRGTMHDLNPTGQFKKCGCFDSLLGDNWQGYIKSQDMTVRERARLALEEIKK